MRDDLVGNISNDFTSSFLIDMTKHCTFDRFGHGFPFRGRYDHAALAEARLGPASLRDRAASLGGTLTIDSEGSGSRVEIALPLAADGVVA